jgi:DNA-binding NarL/FixJ family response regulator
MSEGAYIIVVQQHDSSTKLVRRLMRENPNRVVYLGNPPEALEEMARNPADLVITGSQFYKTSFSHRQDEEQAHATHHLEFLAGGTLEKISMNYQPLRQGPNTGGQLARAVHGIRPDLLVLRYSVTPDEDAMKFGINGDIPKDGTIEPFMRMLHDPELKRIVAGKRWDELKTRYPEIRLYDNLPR